MEMDSKKARYYKNKNEIKRNQKAEEKYFKNKIGKQKRKDKWN